MAYLFAQSALIACIRGNGVELTPTQLPDQQAPVEPCCEWLGMKQHPRRDARRMAVTAHMGAGDLPKSCL